MFTSLVHFCIPNYKALRYATSRQIEECHQRCRQALVNHTFDSVVDEPITEPHHKKKKVFLESLMDQLVKKKITQIKKTRLIDTSNLISRVTRLSIQFFFGPTMRSSFLVYLNWPGDIWPFDAVRQQLSVSLVLLVLLSVDDVLLSTHQHSMTCFYYDLLKKIRS
jgi:hypothetical protein